MGSSNVLSHYELRDSYPDPTEAEHVGMRFEIYDHLDTQSDRYASMQDLPPHAY